VLSCVCVLVKAFNFLFPIGFSSLGRRDSDSVTDLAWNIGKSDCG